MSVELLGREAALKKLGAIGVYEKAVVSRLDELTACDRHEKSGKAPMAHTNTISTRIRQAMRHFLPS